MISLKVARFEAIQGRRSGRFVDHGRVRQGVRHFRGENGGQLPTAGHGRTVHSQVIN